MRKTIWESSLWIHHALDGMEARNESFRQSVEKKAQLASQFLLYDQVVIPTKDFGIVPILVDWFGMYGLLHLLHYQVFHFSWMRDQLGYENTGQGLQFFNIAEPSGGWENWQQAARWGESEIAAEAQIDNVIPSNWCKCIRIELLEAVLKNSTITDLPLTNTLRLETSKDINSSNDLMNWVAAQQSMPKGAININSLNGIASNQFRSIAPGKLSDSIDLVLRVAEINLEFHAAQKMHNCDIGIPYGADRLLKSKLERNGARPTQLDGFLSILELENIPDIRAPIRSGELSIRDFIKIRDSRKARKFRKWLHSTETRDPLELQQMYVASVGGKTSGSWPMRTIRLTCVSAAGVFNPTLGMAAGAVDSFVVDDWINGFSPRLFMDELRSIP